MPAASRVAIDHFLAVKRFAFIGISSKPVDFSRNLFREFVERGYDPLPVNPKLHEVEGRPCYSQVKNIDPGVEAALIMTSSDASGRAVRECAAAGVKLVWLYRAAGKGSVSPAALEACREADIEVVAGECPFLFLSGSHFPHNVHGWLKHATLTYPH